MSKKEFKELQKFVLGKPQKTFTGTDDRPHRPKVKKRPQSRK